MAPSGNTRRSRAIMRRFLDRSNFEDSERDSEDVQSLIRAHKKTMGIVGWTLQDDDELFLYVEGRLYRKDDDRSKKSPTGHSVYRRLNEGPQYITRAGLLFLHALWDHYNLAAFDAAILDYEYAEAAPNGLVKTVGRTMSTKVNRTRPWPKGWVEREAVTSAYSWAIHKNKEGSSPYQPRISQLSLTEVELHSDRDLAPPSPGAMTTQSTPSQSPQIEDSPEPPNSQAIIPAKRRSDVGALAHPLGGSAIEASAKRTKIDRFTPLEHTDRGELPNLSMLIANGTLPNSDRIDEMEDLIDQVQDDLVNVQEHFIHVHARVDAIATDAANGTVMGHQDAGGLISTLDARITALEITTRETLEAVKIQRDDNKKLNHEVAKIWNWCTDLGQYLVTQDKIPEPQED